MSAVHLLGLPSQPITPPTQSKRRLTPVNTKDWLANPENHQGDPSKDGPVLWFQEEPKETWSLNITDVQWVPWACFLLTELFPPRRRNLGKLRRLGKFRQLKESQNHCQVYVGTKHCWEGRLHLWGSCLQVAHVAFMSHQPCWGVSHFWWLNYLWVTHVPVNNANKLIGSLS